MSVATHKMDSLALWAAALTVLTWSSSYAAISFGLRVFTPAELALLRFTVASVCFAIPVALRWIKLPRVADWPAVAALGLIGNTAYQLFLGYGMTQVTA